MSGAPTWKSLFAKNAERPIESPKAGPSNPTGKIAMPSDQNSSTYETSSEVTPPYGQEASPQERLNASLLMGSGVSSGSSTDDLLLTRMDRAAEAFARIMEDDSLIQVGDPPRGVPKYTFAERMKAAEFVRDWVIRRKKLATPEHQSAEAPMIDQLRASIKQVLAEEQVVRIPPKHKQKPGRPSKEEMAARNAAQKAQEMGLQPFTHENPMADASELMKALEQNR